MLASRWTALALLGLGYALALAHGRLEAPALGAVLLLLVAGLAVQPRWPLAVRWLGHGLFIVTALGLALHGFPGFDNAALMPMTQTSPEAQPFITHLNLDKPLIGAWILLACPWALRPDSRDHAPGRAWAAVLLTPALCLTLACLLGVTAWAVKWPAFTLLWLANNLLLVCLTEELLFRAYLQNALQHHCHRDSLKGILPVGISAVLFGLAHVGGGVIWIVLAGLAGVGYGLAWRHGGLWPAVATHWALNLTHFCLFSYPMVKQ